MLLRRISLLLIVMFALAGGARAQDVGLPNGVAAGDVDQTSVILWARSVTPGTVTFAVATDADFGNLVTTRMAEVTDPLLPVKVEVSDLLPQTRYYYRATDAAGASASGTFVTPAAVGTRAGLRFGVSGDWRGDLAPYPSIANADERELAFFIAHGDTIYADYPSPAVPAAQATTLEEYRLKHDEVYSEQRGMNTLGDLRTSTAIFAMIDDHEVVNDFAGGASPRTDARFRATDVAYINDTARFEAGLQAFHEYNPLREEFYGATDDPRTAEERRLYRYRAFGSDAALFLLDTRSFRDEPLSAPMSIAPEDVLEYETASFDPTRTLLGAAQLADLQADLLAAQAAGITWKFIAVPEPMQNFGVVGASDRFEGYAAERTALLSFIDEHNITNVVFIAADIHGTVVNDIFYRAAPGGDDVPLASFEITTGSVAFDAPFGPTVVELGRQLGVVTEQQAGLFQVLPLTARDNLVRGFVDAQLVGQGYDPTGLQNGILNAELIDGSYFVTQTFGWTEFEIDAETQALTVTTYGIPGYTAEDMATDAEALLAETPEIFSQFSVQPND